MAPDSVPPRAAPAPSETEAALRLPYVRRLQRDGRVLLRHVSGRGDRALPGAGTALLFEDTARLAADPPRIAELATCVDALSRAAYPATAATIRLTRAYTRSKEADDDTIGEETMARGRRLRAIMLSLAWSAFAFVLVTLALLAHVDNGRRAQQQFQAARAELRGAYDELARLPPGAWVPAPVGDAAQLPLAPLCDDPKRRPSNTAEGLRASGLCQLAAEAGIRFDMALHLIERWNCRQNQPLGWLYGWLIDRCPSEPRPSPAEPVLPGFSSSDPAQRDLAAAEAAAARERHAAATLAYHWNRTEIRADPAVTTLKGFVLPLLMGFLGGTAYVLRRFGQKLSDQTLEPQDGWHAVLRVLLAAMLGGLLGAVWSGNDALNVGGVDLSLAAAAFFVGFALEAVFSLIEAMVASVSGRIRGEATPPPR